MLCIQPRELRADEVALGFDKLVLGVVQLKAAAHPFFVARFDAFQNLHRNFW